MGKTRTTSMRIYWFCGKRRVGIVQILVEHCAISNGSLLENNNSPTYNGEQYVLKVCLLCIMV